MLDTFNDKGAFVRGDTPYSMLAPAFITVIVEDDSPLANQVGAMVYDVFIEIQAESMGQTIRFSSVEGDPDYDPSLRPTVEGGGLNAEGGRLVSGEGQRVFYTFRMPELVLPAASDYADDPGVVQNGLTVKSVRFLADVAGDYRISVKQKHLFFDEKAYNKNLDKEYVPGDRSYVNPFTGLKGDDALLSPTEAYESGEEIFKQWPVAPTPSTSR